MWVIDKWIFFVISFFQTLIRSEFCFSKYKEKMKKKGIEALKGA